MIIRRSFVALVIFEGITTSAHETNRTRINSLSSHVGNTELPIASPMQASLIVLRGAFPDQQTRKSCFLKAEHHPREDEFLSGVE
jgi:hypothetical protein